MVEGKKVTQEHFTWWHAFGNAALHAHCTHLFLSHAYVLQAMGLACASNDTMRTP
jgi:hypothetical protein